MFYTGKFEKKEEKKTALVLFLWEKEFKNPKFLSWN